MNAGFSPARSIIESLIIMIPDKIIKNFQKAKAHR